MRKICIMVSISALFKRASSGGDLPRQGVKKPASKASKKSIFGKILGPISVSRKNYKANLAREIQTLETKISKAQNHLKQAQLVSEIQEKAAQKIEREAGQYPSRTEWAQIRKVRMQATKEGNAKIKQALNHIEDLQRRLDKLKHKESKPTLSWVRKNIRFGKKKT